MRFCLPVLLCCVLWRGGAAAAGGDGFPAAAARLLRDIRMPAARAALVPTVLADLREILQHHYPGCDVVLFGSIATGLATVESDIDVCIKVKHQLASDAYFVLRVSRIMLQYPHLFQVIESKSKARVPFLTVRHIPTHFSVDLSFNDNGIMSGKLVHYLMGLDDRARDLAQILKHSAKLHNVTKGVGTKLFPNYGIATMTIFYLQQIEILPKVACLQKDAESVISNYWNMGFREVNFEIINNESLCEILGGFFKYYNEFDYEKHMASPFVGRALEIDRFRELDTVPVEFELYKTNVRLNISQSLKLQIPIIQDIFEHNANLAYRIADTAKLSAFKTLVEHAAKKFQGGCTGFLDAILNIQ